MTPADLVKSLSEEIKDACAGIRLLTEYGEVPAAENVVSVNVFEQVLPKDCFENTTYLPFVLIELLQVEDDLKEGSTAQIGLSFGVYGLESDGWQDLVHLTETCRERLLTKRLIAQKYRLVRAEWQTVQADTQPLPFQYATAILTYSIFQPQDVEIINTFC